jgi:hypothetical protein
MKGGFEALPLEGSYDRQVTGIASISTIDFPPSSVLEGTLRLKSLWKPSSPLTFPVITQFGFFLSIKNPISGEGLASGMSLLCYESKGFRCFLYIKSTFIS